MKSKVTTLLVSALVLAGCATPTPPVLNPSGNPVKFVDPILGKNGMENARYVLLEKNIADGKYKLVSMSKTRQPITNERQERIAFNADLTGYAPDYTDYAFETYADSGNYNQQTVIMRCAGFPLKTQKYNPCTSAFGELFIPTGITKAYVAGSMSANAMKAWQDPARNRIRYVESPRFALSQAGVFSRLPELAAAQ